MKYLVIICSCLFIFSCQSDKSHPENSIGKSESAEAVFEMEEEFEANQSQFADHNSAQNSIEKASKIIKSGSVKFEVTNLEKVKSRVDSTLASHKGYYENERFSSHGNRNTYHLILRIPNKNFDALVHSLENDIGEMKEKNINSNDVTEEYVDLNIRLDNKLAYLNQYKTILNKAKSIQDILEVQEKIRSIEEEIESKKGRINLLDDKVNYSTLNLELTELIKGPFSTQPSFARLAFNAFNNGTEGFLTFIIAMINLWPFLLILVFMFLGRKRVFRLFKNT